MKKISFLLLTLALFACEDQSQEISPVETITETPDSGEVIHPDEIFLVTEKSASFPRGTEAYVSFLDENLQYPALAKQMGIEGRVFVSFIVSKSGNISDIQLIKGIGGGCDEEVVRLIKSSPNWIPAEQRGKIVHSRMQTVITFKINDQDRVEIATEKVEAKLTI